MGTLLRALSITAVVLVSYSLGCRYASAQVVGSPLTVDAEYQGALLARDRELVFYPSGRIASGYLKGDFAYRSFIFQAGTKISFFNDGSVSQGTTSRPVTYEQFNLIPGTVAFHVDGKVQQASATAGSDGNLTIPSQCELTFDRSAKVVSLSRCQAQAISILQRSVIGGGPTELIFEAGSYRLVKGTVAVPQVIARIVVAHLENGQPASVAPIVVPAGSGFSLPIRPELVQPGQSSFERWTVNGSFSLIGNSYGIGPVLLVRDMSLKGVQLSQAVVIGGVQYKATDIINLNEKGQVVR